MDGLKERIINRLDPEELIDILGLSTEELVDILEAHINNSASTFDFLEEGYDEV